MGIGPISWLIIGDDMGVWVFNVFSIGFKGERDFKVGDVIDGVNDVIIFRGESEGVFSVILGKVFAHGNGIEIKEGI